jgi:hypothetical protein
MDLPIQRLFSSAPHFSYFFHVFVLNKSRRFIKLERRHVGCQVLEVPGEYQTD